MRLPNPRTNKSGLSFFGLVFALIIIGAMAATWFRIINPYLFSEKVGLANHKLEFNLFSEAKNIYEELLTKSPPEYKVMIQDRIRQIPLAEKYLVDIAPEDPRFSFGALDALTAKIGLIYIRFIMTNHGNIPVPVRRSLFYLKSATSKCEVALDRPQNSEVSVLEGDLLPGESMQGGICVKYILAGNEVLYLVYNNGDIYLNNKISASIIWPQTDKNEFDKAGWKGSKSVLTETQNPSVANPVATQHPQQAKKQPAIRNTSPPSKSPLPENIKKSTIAQPSVSNDVPLTQTKEQTSFTNASTATKAKIKKPTPKGFYQDRQYGFSVQVPQNWKIIKSSALDSGNVIRVIPSVAIFKGPQWQDRFPALLIQKSNKAYATSLQIGSDTLKDMESDIRRQLHNCKIKKLISRSTLLGNTKVGEIDTTFTYQDRSYRMKSFVFEGKPGYILICLAPESDYSMSESQALSALKTFRP